jgi:hypothetical protein
MPAARRPGAPTAQANPATPVNRPATGLASGASRANAAAVRGRSRCSASAAASPNAVPSANGSRPVASSVAVPAASQIPPQRARSGPKCRWTSRSKSAAHATHEATRSRRGPISHDSGGPIRL